MARCSSPSRACLWAAPWLLLSGATAVLGGCTDTGGDDVAAAVPASVSVDPERFLGSVRCSAGSGDLETYVATLFDLGASDEDDRTYEAFTLPSSPPTSCAARALFRFVIPGHRYRAEVDAYDVGLADPGALVPAGEDCSNPDDTDDVNGSEAPGLGSRHMCTPTPDGGLAPIAPRWTSRCGDEPAISVESREVRIGDCEPLTDHGHPPAPTVHVDPNVTLGTLSCRKAGGRVATFDVIPQGPALPAVLGIACGEIPEPFDGSITADRRYDFRVEAFDGQSGRAAWGASCFAVADAGRAVFATCTPLTDRGVLRVPLGAVGAKCPPDATTYHVELTTATNPTTTTRVGPFACTEDATIRTVVAGSYSVVVEASDGTTFALCSADVQPDAFADAACGFTH